jgi:adenylylsulfate reductase subunit B
MKRFKFPIRTTSWGSIQPFKDCAEPTADMLKSQMLAHEPTKLMADLPTLARA